MAQGGCSFLTRPKFARRLNTPRFAALYMRRTRGDEGRPNAREAHMKRGYGPTAVVAAFAFGGFALADVVGEHKAFLPQDIPWSVAPASLPAGAEAAVLYGDPSKEGEFTMRLKLPKGYRIAPHTHPKPEAITVISGVFKLGLGPTGERAGVETLPAGSFSMMPKGVVHYVFADEDAIVQINATGPWSIEYVNPKDDPRNLIAPQR